MRLIILASVIILIIACNSKAPKDSFVTNDWHIISILDGKNKIGNPMSLNYTYRNEDTLKALIHFLNDTTYVLKDLFEKGTDTNYFEMHGDTLITNREPKDYLVVTKSETDSVFLINKSEQLIFTLVKTR